MSHTNTTKPPVISLSKLNKSYSNEYIQTLALQNIDMDVFPGEFISIMGPSGCGKSTLMSTLGLLDSFDSGSYLLNSTDTSKLNVDQRAKIRNKHIGFVFQSFNLIDTLNVADNIALPLQYQNVSNKEISSKVDLALEQVDLLSRAKHFPAQLSGGQQQRVAIARAIVTNPALILVDEPTGNLDSQNGDQVMKLLMDLNKLGTTIIMVTHDTRYARCASRQIQLIDGEIVMENQQDKVGTIHAAS